MIDPAGPDPTSGTETLRLPARATAPAPDGAAASAGAGVLRAARLRILRTLQEQGPTAVSDLPHRWPLTRMHLALFVDRMAAEGVVELSAAAAGAVCAEVRLAPGDEHGGGAGEDPRRDTPHPPREGAAR